MTNEDEDDFPVGIVIDNPAVVNIITDQQDISDHLQEEAEPIEDSQPIDDGSDSDVSEDIGSASEYINSDSDIEADVQTPLLTVMTIEQPDMSHSPPVPARRPERNRMEPKWMRS